MKQTCHNDQMQNQNAFLNKNYKHMDNLAYQRSFFTYKFLSYSKQKKTTTKLEFKVRTSEFHWTSRKHLNDPDKNLSDSNTIWRILTRIWEILIQSEGLWQESEWFQYILKDPDKNLSDSNTIWMILTRIWVILIQSEGLWQESERFLYNQNDPDKNLSDSNTIRMILRRIWVILIQSEGLWQESERF